MYDRKYRHPVIIKRSLAVVLAAFFALASVAQTSAYTVCDSVTGTAHIDFPFDDARIAPDYGNNAVELDRINRMLDLVKNDTNAVLQGMSIHGYGSPEGTFRRNSSLAQARTDSIAAYISRRNNLPEGFIKTSTTAEDWDGLERFVREAPAELLPHRSGLLRILQSDRSSGGMEWAMKTMYPADYNVIRKECFPRLRRTEFCIVYLLKCPLEPAIEPVAVEPEAKVDSVIVSPVAEEPQDQFVIEKRKRTIFYVRMNMLLPLLNIGIEVPIGNRWSVAADWHYPWLFRNWRHENCYQMDGLLVEGRYWFGKKHKPGEENRKYRLRGHSVGLFTMLGRYDLQHNYEGHQGEYVMGGIDYLWAKPIFKGKMHLELCFGVGFFYTQARKYHVYEEGGKGYRDKNYRKHITYFGPLRAGVNLVVPIKWTTKKKVKQ